MALRQAFGRPLGHAVRSASYPRPATVRTFATTALRPKEVAGDTQDVPHLRVRWPLTRPTNAPLLTPAASTCPASPRRRGRRPPS